jgi:hypothetical protein
MEDHIPLSIFRLYPNQKSKALSLINRPSRLVGWFVQIRNCHVVEKNAEKRGLTRPPQKVVMDTENPNDGRG